MQSEKGVTLMELVIALVLLGAVATTTTVSFVSIKSLRQNFLNRDEALIQANLAVATIFERALRAGVIGAQGLAFRIPIQDRRRKVVLKRGTIEEQIWFDPATGQIKYKEGDKPDRVILRGVEELIFFNDFRQRLALELTLKDGQKIRTAVQPRNQGTPQNLIN